MHTSLSDGSGPTWGQVESVAWRPVVPDRSTVDLVGAGGYFMMSSRTWQNVLELARTYGWQPAGTEPPDGLPRLEPWSGEYGAHSGQRVTVEDTRSLAAALERVAAAIPDDGAPPRGDPGLASFAGDNKPWLSNLIAFCRAGGFYIW
jgi:hypothetical protein